MLKSIRALGIRPNFSVECTIENRISDAHGWIDGCCHYVSLSRNELLTIGKLSLFFLYVFGIGNFSVLV